MERQDFVTRLKKTKLLDIRNKQNDKENALS